MLNDETNRGEKDNEYFILVSLIARKLAYPPALFFRRIGFSANMVTALGGCLWVVSVVTIIISGWCRVRGDFISSNALLLTTVFLWNAGFILDVADGSLARMTNSCSSGGSYLDYCFHLIFHPMFFCSIGIFLFLVTDGLIYLILGVLSIFAGWGVSFSAKEHVLCEHIAKGDVDPAKLGEENRYRIFIDSVKTKTSVSGKKRASFMIALVREVFCFPGQYTFVSLIIIADIVLLKYIDVEFVLLRLVFVSMVLVSLFRVPFRLKREYRTLELYDCLRKKGDDTGE